MKASDRNNNLSKSRNLKAPRADFHDYTAPGYYLITITAYQGTPRLSTINTPCDAILRKGEMIIPDNTELGERVKDELIALPKKNPKLQIRRYVIMPDHIHFVLQVVSELEKTIGRYIAPFTKTCSQAYTRISNLPLPFQLLRVYLLDSVPILKFNFLFRFLACFLTVSWLHPR